MGIDTTLTNIHLGDRENRKQTCVVVPAQNVANKPGILCLQGVSGTTVTNYYIWPNTSGVLRYGSTFPTAIDSDGAAVGAAASVTLDQAFDNGATIDGASSSGTAVKIGYTSASSYNTSFYHNGTNMYMAVNAGDLYITAAGGEIDFGNENLSTTGTLASGAITVGADSTKIGLGASGATDSYIMFDGTDLQFYDSNYGSEVSLTEIAGGALNNPTVTGDLTITDGKITWTDAANEVAGAWTFSNVANDGIDLVMASMTTANGIHVVADALTNGHIVNLQSSTTGWGTGTFLNATHDGTNSVFSVGQNGAVTIAGSASGTDALTVTAGDFKLTAGEINAANAADVVAFSFDRNHASSSNAVFHIHQDHTGSTGVILDLVQDGTGAAPSINLSTAGTGSAVNITNTVVTGTGMTIIGPASQTASQLILDGTTGSWLGAATTGQLHVKADGALVADASLVRLVSSGNIAAANDGYALEIVETGSAQATSYAVRIASTNNEALHVDTGLSLFDETVAISIANTANIDALTVTQADSTNNKDAIVVSTTGTGYVLKGTVASTTGKGLGMIGCADQTTSIVTIDGVTGNWLGGDGVGMLNLTCDGTLAHANASLLYIAHSGAMQTSQLGSSLRINDSSTAATTAYVAYMTSTNNNILELVGAATGKNQLTITGPASQTASMVVLTSTFVGANDTGALHIAGTGNLAHTGASLVRVTSSGTMQANTEAILLNLEDTGTAGATSYCVRINSTNNEALNVSAGKVVFAENLTVSSGGVTLTADDLALSEGKITLASTQDEVSATFARNHATSTSAVVEIENTHTGATGPCLLIDQNATGNAYGIQISHDGDYAAIYCAAGAARTGPVIEAPMANQLNQRALYVTGAWTGQNGYGAIDVNSSGVLAAGASLVNLTSTGANTAASYLLNISHSTGAFTDSTNGLCIRSTDAGAAAGTSYNTYISSTANNGAYIYTGATGKTALTIDAVQATTAAMLNVVAGTGTGWVGADGVGAVTITGDGTIAHANASLLYVTHAGTGKAANTGLGTCVRVVDASVVADTPPAYALYVSSTNNEGLYVDTGLAKFDEGPLVQYSAAAATDGAPKPAELNTAFGITVGAGYNGFVGVLYDNNGATGGHLCFVANAVWYFCNGTLATA